MSLPKDAEPVGGSSPRLEGLYELDFWRHMFSAHALMLCAENLLPTLAPLSES